MKGWLAGMALVLAPTMTGGAGADVKSGVDAWARGDWKRAVEEWRAPALAGDPDAQFNLGQAYKLGRGVPLDPVLARSWFLKAANQGHLPAADNYGLALFEDGQKAAAAPWLEKSVARGEKRAQLVLGTMAFNGDGVPRDQARGYALMTRASQQGLKSASETLAQMDAYISPADRQRGVALAQRYAVEQDAQRIAATAAAPPAPAREERSFGMAPQPVARAAPPPPEPVAAARPMPRSRPAPPAAAAAGGGWHVQLGAFRDAGNAHALWQEVGARVGGQASYLAGGGVTRLRAGPFPTRAAAERACAAAKGGCVVVAP